MSFTLSDFDYHLPEERIAQKPAVPRDHSRLLVFDRATEQITDDYFYNLPQHLPTKSRLVLNNSKVEKCRLLFGNKEVFVHKAYNPTTVEALVRPGKKFKKGKTVELDEGLSATVLDVSEDGLRILRLNTELESDALAPYRYTPFPPYLEQDESLADQYQTIYAKEKGSKAAPTAGLHFTDRLFEALDEKGFPRTEVTLHVGLGTFAPVKTEDLDEHVMHHEEYHLSTKNAAEINAAEHITAVGTTSVRVLESMADEKGRVEAGQGSTDLFIRPGYKFRRVDSMITNFHLPKSTLLMLVSAFMGYENMHNVYQHAIEQEYRFYSFGDAMLII